MGALPREHLQILIFSHFEGEPADHRVSEILIDEIEKIRTGSAGSAGRTFDFNHEEERLAKQLSFVNEKLSLDKPLAGQKLKTLSLEMTKFAVLSRRLQRESVSEFIEPFEKFLRDCKKLQLKLPEESAEIFCEVVKESYRMIRESDMQIEEADFSPEALLKSLQIPLELKEKLAQIKRKIDFPEARLPEEKEFIIRIKSLNGQDNIFNPQTLIEAISGLGKVSLPGNDFSTDNNIQDEEGSENEFSN